MKVRVALYARTILIRRCEEAMCFKSADVWLVIPLRRTSASRLEEPKRAGGGVSPFAANGTFGEANIFVPSALIKISLLCRLESSRALEHHIPDVSDVFEIKTIGADTVNTDVADHKHTQLAFSFRFRTHESS